jgi:hypothetical protein
VTHKSPEELIRGKIAKLHGAEPAQPKAEAPTQPRETSPRAQRLHLELLYQHRDRLKMEHADRHRDHVQAENPERRRAVPHGRPSAETLAGKIADLDKLIDEHPANKKV